MLHFSILVNSSFKVYLECGSLKKVLSFWVLNWNEHSPNKNYQSNEQTNKLTNKLTNKPTNQKKNETNKQTNVFLRFKSSWLICQILKSILQIHL
jgi:hypothetical protein